MKHTKHMIASILAGSLLSLILVPQTPYAMKYKPGFTSREISQNMKKRITGNSYPASGKAKIKYSDLRYLSMQYIGFDGKTHTGEMIVNKKIAFRTLKIFYKLYKMKYPIEKMRLIDDYKADDEKSMADNNSSAFNYRFVAHTTRLSNHSYGLAIDINPKINPYITSHGVSPANGKAYATRNVKKCKGKYANYMIHKNDKIVKLFKKYGFTWGGNWKSVKDYQHFEFK